MKNLLYKEVRLALHPTNFIFLTFFLMVFIPGYPYYVAPFWTILGVNFLCMNGRENHDVDYSLLLPVRKRDIVKARITVVCALELLQLLLAVPAFIIKDAVMPMDNPLGMEANLAFVGISLVLLGVFNLLFFTRYYKNTNKVGVPFVVAMAVYWVLLILAEAMTYFVPFFQYELDTRGTQFLGAKLAVLAVGAAAFAALTFLAYRSSAKSFEKLDL